MTDTTASEKTSGSWRFANASLHSRSLYLTAHPDSDMGDPNYADQVGYELVCYTPAGLMVYQRKHAPMAKQDPFLGAVITAMLLGFVLVLLFFPYESINTVRVGGFLAVLWIIVLFDYLARLFRGSS